MTGAGITPATSGAIVTITGTTDRGAGFFR
jgi:hypothetical protein